METLFNWTYSLTQMHHSNASSTDATHLSYPTPPATTINSNPELQNFSSAVSQSLHLHAMDISTTQS